MSLNRLPVLFLVLFLALEAVLGGTGFRHRRADGYHVAGPEHNHNRAARSGLQRPMMVKPWFAPPPQVQVTQPQDELEFATVFDKLDDDDELPPELINDHHWNN